MKDRGATLVQGVSEIMSAHRCVGSGSRISGEDRVQNGGKAQKPTLHSCAGWLCIDQNQQYTYLDY